MMKQFNIEDLVDLCIGPVDPCGSHSEDQKRLENLKTLCQVSSALTERLCRVAITAHADRASMKEMADYARQHLEEEIEGMGNCIKTEE